MEGAVIQRVLIDEAIEVLFQRAGHFRRATGSWVIHQSLGALVSKAIHPLAQGGIRKLERVGDGLEALPFDDLTHGLGTAEDACLFRLFHEGI
jgi:hypothetical protein